MLRLILLFSMAIGEPAEPRTCSVRELRESPGYRYRVERIRQFIDSADVVVRAKAVAEYPRSDSLNRPMEEIYWRRVRFEVTERLRGPDSLELLELPGRLVTQDDYNRDPVPYTIVRHAGQRGDCFAREYRRGAEYLFILESGAHGLSAQWKPLAPFNEQLRGNDDPWLEWVRGVVSGRRDGGA